MPPPAAGRLTGLTDRDGAGTLRYRIQGLNGPLTGGTLDRRGARIFQQIDGVGTIVRTTDNDAFTLIRHRRLQRGWPSRVIRPPAP